MAATRKAVQSAPLAALRLSVGRLQTRAERLLVRVRRDAEALVARSRREVVKEMRTLERRLLRSIHAATREDVSRLERRVAKLESELPGLQPSARTGSERAA